MIEKLRSDIFYQGELPSPKELRHIKHQVRLESLTGNTETSMPHTRAFWDVLILALGGASFWQIGKEKMAAERERKLREFAESQKLQVQADPSEQSKPREITVGDLIPEGGSTTYRVARMREVEHRYGATLRSGSTTQKVAAMRQIRHGR